MPSRRHARSLVLTTALIVPVIATCRDPLRVAPPPPEPATSSLAANSSPAAESSTASAEPRASASSSAAAFDSAPASSSSADTSACGPDMVLVEGEYCPLVEQRCLEHKGDADQDSDQAICLRYERPSKCVAPKLVHMRYCMDRYEYPNKPGELPRTLTDFGEAMRLCKEQGKRLCSESEFNFACEGEEMRPYATGFERDAAACNYDKPFVTRPADMKEWDDCMKDAKCKAEFARVDQRAAAGASSACVSPFGVHDMNGNVNEWVMLRYKRPPHRSAVKGGWWGPVRNRCRPIVTSHNEHYVGYEVGFRCCKRP